MSSKRTLVDTNLIVRYLVQDHEKHAKAAGKLFEACDQGEVEIVVLSAILAECVFVLESFYEHPRADIAAALSTLISSPGVGDQRRLGSSGRAGPLSKNEGPFVHCLVAAAAKAGDTPVATFDEGSGDLATCRLKTDERQWRETSGEKRQEKT